MLKKYLLLTVFSGILALPLQSSAHTTLFACFDNGDGTIFCEGGFSDGSTAAGVPVIVVDASRNVIFEGELSRNSDIEFDKPDGEYSVMLDGGEGHRIEIPGARIFE